MKTTHFIAIFNHLEGTNKLLVILAENPAKALMKALIENIDEEYRTADYIAWIEGLGDNVESIVQGAHEGELSISNIITV